MSCFLFYSCYHYRVRRHSLKVSKQRFKYRFLWLSKQLVPYLKTDLKFRDAIMKCLSLIMGNNALQNDQKDFPSSPTCNSEVGLSCFLLNVHVERDFLKLNRNHSFSSSVIFCKRPLRKLKFFSGYWLLPFMIDWEKHFSCKTVMIYLIDFLVWYIIYTRKKNWAKRID